MTARPELRDELLEVVPPIPMTEPAPTRTWLMPAIGKTYSTEREIPEDEPGDERQVAATGTIPEKPLREARGGVTNGSDDVETSEPIP